MRKDKIIIRINYRNTTLKNIIYWSIPLFAAFALVSNSAQAAIRIHQDAACEASNSTWFIMIHPPPPKKKTRKGWEKKTLCCVGRLLKGLSKLDKFSFALLHLTMRMRHDYTSYLSEIEGDPVIKPPVKSGANLSSKLVLPILFCGASSANSKHLRR